MKTVSSTCGDLKVRAVLRGLLAALARRLNG
jgi:hypothetical protein